MLMVIVQNLGSWFQKAQIFQIRKRYARLPSSNMVEVKPQPRQKCPELLLEEDRKYNKKNGKNI